MARKKVLIVDDEKLIRWSLKQKLSEWNIDVTEAENGKEGLRMMEEEIPDLVMLDVNLPDKKGTDLLVNIKKIRPEIPVIMITAYGIIDEVVTSMRRGAYDFITKPLNYTKLRTILKNALETLSLKQEIAYYKEKEKNQIDSSQIIASSKMMKEILEMTEKIALSETTIVLLQGESGTGKDLLAQAIHHMSRRKSAPFLAINCSAIPENLLESELFGYEKGAFTDAKQQKKGLIELTDEGTLFLDEISTLSLGLQAKLLRFLETQTFKRVGGLKDIEVDIRVIAATNQDLEIASDEEKFRRDLFYRLNVCPINIPPLRERKDDILPMAEHFIRKDNVKFRKEIKGLNKEAKALFLSYDWPGNVRELRNAIERAMIFEETPLITPNHLPIQLEGKSKAASTKIETRIRTDTVPLEEMEKALLIKALKKSNGNKTKAAELLKISRDTLRYRLKKFNITQEEEV
jgi:DNA-binding NtrC family response regulator